MYHILSSLLSEPLFHTIVGRVCYHEEWHYFIEFHSEFLVISPLMVSLSTVFFLGPYPQLENLRINRCQYSILPEILYDSNVKAMLENHLGITRVIYAPRVTMHSTDQEMLSCIVVNRTLRGQMDIKAQSSDSEVNNSLLSPLSLIQSIAMTELPVFHNLIFVASIIAFCAFLIIRYTWSPWQKLPPGPRGFPLVGNVLQPNSQLWLSFTQWKKTYGGIL